MKSQAELIAIAAEAVESLTDIADLTDTVHVEVALDTVASAFSNLKGPRRAQSRGTSKVTLAEVLSRFAEADLAEPVALSLCDEITKLIEFKDYEGYSEEYVTDRLDSLLVDLQNELQKTLDKLRAQKNE